MPTHNKWGYFNFFIFYNKALRIGCVFLPSEHLFPTISLLCVHIKYVYFDPHKLNITYILRENHT